MYPDMTLSCEEVVRTVPPVTRLTDRQYARLLAFRVELRRFLRWSEEQAATVGLTPAQHQLMLAIRGHPGPRGPSIRELADYLSTRHHSAVQLIDRAEQLGLVTRHREDSNDRRIVRLTLTKTGEEKLVQLSTTHLEELQRLATLIHAVVDPTIA
jgi:DNA-binding MarR family transcriptional regulator